MGERLKEAVAMVVHDGQGNVLVGQKRVDFGSLLSGQNHLPGETKETDETDEQAIVRGIMEEAGVGVVIVRYLASHVTPKGTTVRWYECRAEETDLAPSSDLEKVFWVPLEQVVEVCSTKSVDLWPEEVKILFLNPAR